MNPDPLYVDEEPWDITDGAVVYTASWLTAGVVVAALLALAVLLIWRKRP
jgi:hypothetical protein